MKFSLTGSIRATGGAIAIAIYGSIINNKVQKNLIPDVTAAAIEAGLAPSAIESFISMTNCPLSVKYTVEVLTKYLAALSSGSSSALGSLEGITPAIIAAGRIALQTVYANAFRLVFLVSIAFGGQYRVAEDPQT